MRYEDPNHQTPNRRCCYCGEGLTCPHGYCEVCQDCFECVVEEHGGEA